jgi:putative spermidine/putrescine transport system permease protein
MRRGLRIAPWAPWGLLYGFCGLMLLFLAAPIVIVLLVSFSDAEFVYFPPPGFTLRWYAHLMRMEGFVPSFLLSLRLALLVSGLALMLGTAASLALARYPFPGRQWLNTFFMSPLIFPPIITGIALLQFFSTLGIRATFFMLTVGHTLIAIPYVVRNVTASLEGLRSNVEEAARLLGANPWQTFWHITLPLIKPGLLAGGIFAFITSFDNYTISMWLKSAEETTLPLRIFFYIERIMDPSVAAVSGAMIVFSIVLVIVTEKVVGLSRTMNV